VYTFVSVGGVTAVAAMLTAVVYFAIRNDARRATKLAAAMYVWELLERSDILASRRIAGSTPPDELIQGPNAARRQKEIEPALRAYTIAANYWSMDALPYNALEGFYGRSMCQMYRTQEPYIQVERERRGWRWLAVLEDFTCHIEGLKRVFPDFDRTAMQSTRPGRWRRLRYRHLYKRRIRASSRLL